MKMFLMKLRMASITATVIGITFLLMAGTARAAFLYWGSTAVKTASVGNCLGFAQNAMHNLNFQNVRRSQNEVAGTSGGTYAAITCFATTPRATAIVMVVGDDGGETARVRDSLRTKIAAITPID
jgi:hypothetical protein